MPLITIYYALKWSKSIFKLNKSHLHQKKKDSPPGQWRKELSNEGDPCLRKGVGKNLEMMEPPALTENKA